MVGEARDAGVTQEVTEMRSKSKAGGRGQEGKVCGQLPPGAGGERRGAGKLGEAWPSSAAGWAGLGDGHSGRAEERHL